MDTTTQLRKRWLRPTFSLRSLILLTTLVCLYLAGWHLTITRGVKTLAGYLGVDPLRANIEVKAPLLMARPLTNATLTTSGVRVVITNTFYLWMFGRFIELPFTTEQVRNLGPPQPRMIPPMRGTSPSQGPADTPPYQRAMPYRLETAGTGEMSAYV